MTLKKYFQDTKGIGVLATADADGKVDVAIYARPHFLQDSDDELVFVMNDRRSHANLDSNPNAAYLFVEDGKGYSGKRLYLTRTGEDTDEETIQTVRRKNLPPECNRGTDDKFLVTFHVNEVRPLVGG